MRLRDLPIMPGESGSDFVADTYVSERQMVKTADQLMSFTNRWKAIWGIQFKDDKKTIEELALIAGNYDVEAAMSCFKIYRKNEHLRKHRKSRVRKKHIKRAPHCGHISPSCYGMHIMLPPLLLHAFMISNHYRVPTDIAIIQMCGGFGALYGDDNERESSDSLLPTEP